MRKGCRVSSKKGLRYNTGWAVVIVWTKSHTQAKTKIYTARHSYTAVGTRQRHAVGRAPSAHRSTLTPRIRHHTHTSTSVFVCCVVFVDCGASRSAVCGWWRRTRRLSLAAPRVPLSHHRMQEPPPLIIAPSATRCVLSCPCPPHGTRAAPTLG